MKTRRRKPVRKTRRRGGKIIGQGAFANVLDPPIACRDGRDMTKYVTRISKREKKEDIVSKDHPKLIRRLKEIDPNQKYFYYPEHCEPGVLSEDNKRDGATYKNKKYSEIVLKGTEEWNPLKNKTRSWDGFLKGKSKGRKIPMPEKSKEQIDHLYKAIKLLHENGIVHGDLHGKNVIMADDGMPRIIDFGSSLVDAAERYIEMEKGYIEDSWPTLDYNWRLTR
jgi:serine/threonine protein kinase